METAQDEGKAGNNSNNNSNNDKDNDKDNSQWNGDATQDMHLSSSVPVDSDSDDFDCNDEFYLEYFSDLPAASVNGTAILENFVRTDTSHSVNPDSPNPNCNNNARGSNTPQGASNTPRGGSKTPRGAASNPKGAKKAKKAATPSPPPLDDPELYPRGVTLTAYGDRGVSDLIQIDMNKADDFEVREGGFFSTSWCYFLFFCSCFPPSQSSPLPTFLFFLPLCNNLINIIHHVNSPIAISHL
jgi:hypothetical protein